MPEGGQLTIETSNVDVGDDDDAAPPLPQPGPYVMLVVTDDGVGMDADTRAHVFEPFFTTKELGRGTGLGLSSVYGIVQQSGGTIAIDSEVGVGTSFRLYLPRVAPQTLPGADRRGLPSVGGGETVLLVEDEAGLRDVIQEILEGAGYHVLAASDGMEALQVATAHTGPIHLMVTDVIMPGVTGPRAANEIRATRPGMEVLYLSGYPDDTLLREGVLGAAAFLEKPFASESLLRKVRELLNPR
jgi:two-component system cell cycle sensor histidine kinase/response regulator CckA